MADVKISEAALLDPLQLTDRVPVQRTTTADAFLLSVLLSFLRSDDGRLSQLSFDPTTLDGHLMRWLTAAGGQLADAEPAQSDTVVYARRHTIAGAASWVASLAASLPSALAATAGITMNVRVWDTATLGGTHTPTVSGGMFNRFTGTTAVTVQAMASAETGVTIYDMPAGSNVTFVGDYENAGTGPRTPDGPQYVTLLNFGTGGGLFNIWSHGVP